MALRMLAACLLGLVAAVDDTGDSVSLLQVKFDEQKAQEKMDPMAPLAHHWPHARGRVGRLSITEYPMETSSGNLSDSLLWRKYFGPGEMIFGSVIDHERNTYTGGISGVTKLGPDGKEIWKNSDHEAMYAVLVGNAVCTQGGLEHRTARCLSLETGRPFWSREVYPTVGLGGNQLEAHNGVLMVAAGVYPIPGLSDMTGVANDRIIGLNASTGDELWQFKVSCGMWMFMGLFPDDDTTLFQDQCGGVYRLGLFNGSLLWYTPGVPQTLSDGAAILGPDGSTYSCSMAEGARVIDNNDPHFPGILRKFRLSDGKVLWTAKTPYPCTNIPAVTADGGTLVVAPGAIPAVDGPLYFQREQVLQLSHEGREDLYATYQAMERNNTLRSAFGMPDMTGALMGFDTRTGELQWRHEVPPSGLIQSAGDMERNYEYFVKREIADATAPFITKLRLEGDFVLPHCGPAHWSPPTLDLAGRVYIGDSMGAIRVYDPKTDKRLDFKLNDGFVPSGPASAPGLMVFTSCQSVWAFKAQGA